jgi:hypothetical protein
LTQWLHTRHVGKTGNEYATLQPKADEERNRKLLANMFTLELTLDLDRTSLTLPLTLYPTFQDKLAAADIALGKVHVLLLVNTTTHVQAKVEPIKVACAGDGGALEVSTFNLEAITMFGTRLGFRRLRPGFLQSVFFFLHFPW